MKNWYRCVLKVRSQTWCRDSLIERQKLGGFGTDRENERERNKWESDRERKETRERERKRERCIKWIVNGFSQAASIQPYFESPESVENRSLKRKQNCFGFISVAANPITSPTTTATATAYVQCNNIIAAYRFENVICVLGSPLSLSLSLSLSWMPVPLPKLFYKPLHKRESD